MTVDKRDVIALTMEFWITLVVLLGGGFLLYSGHATDIAVAAITSVITFWFQRRTTERVQAQKKTDPIEPNPQDPNR